MISRSPRLFGVLGRRISLPVAAPGGLIVLDLLLIIVCGLALRRNVALGREVAQDRALLTPAKGMVGPSAPPSPALNPLQAEPSPVGLTL